MTISLTKNEVEAIIRVLRENLDTVWVLPDGTQITNAELLENFLPKLK